MSGGDLLAFLDADDAWLDGMTVAALDANPRAVLAFCDFLPMNAAGELLERSAAGHAPSMDEMLSRGWPHRCEHKTWMGSRYAYQCADCTQPFASIHTC